MSGEQQGKPWMCNVVVSWKPRTETPGGWWASVRWSCGQFCEPGLIDGEIRTRYPTGLKLAIDQVMSMAEELGIRCHENMDMGIFVCGFAEESDGKDPDHPLPRGWRNKLRREAARRGWESYSDADKP